MSEFPFSKVENKIQEKWKKHNVFQTPKNPKKKYYILEMFSYPSGDLHVGHLRNYVIVDLLARYYAQKGYDILHPIGWDAFGLPAEEAAIKNKIDPETWTLKNINTSRNTLKSIGIGYDWTTELMTCSKDYYKWTQWIFIKLYENGLAYRDTAFVNWCPGCNTVLANEQVEEGKCWRCHSEVNKRELDQWFFKITDYADKLLEDLKYLDGKWPEPVITAQKNWIGRSEGAEVDFAVENSDLKLTVFTTRPDTLWGVTFAAIAPEHKLLSEIIKNSSEKSQVDEYVIQSLAKTDIERTSTISEKNGVHSGVFLIHPLNGDKIPLYVCDYVLASYGTGVVMAVPAHDKRDFAFARKYDIPIKIVIQPKCDKLDVHSMENAFTEPGIMVESSIFTGKKSDVAIPEIIEYLIDKKVGRKKINFKLHDWLVSRQRYWGAPIPMIYCEKCGIVTVPKEDLPVTLPENIDDYLPKGRSVLSGIEHFVNVNCPKCGADAKRDGDTLDTFVDSSWYHLRYPDVKNDKELISKGKSNSWLPVDQYIGGMEHATGHLIYFRFITKFLNDIGVIEVNEPAARLFNQGMVCGADGSVMSKSKSNGVEAGQFVVNFGADVCRVTTLFLAPPGKDAIWTEQGVAGVKRFLDRVWRLGERIKSSSVEKHTEMTVQEKDLDRIMNMTIMNVTNDIEHWGFNTAIAFLMEMVNKMVPFKNSNSPVFHRAYKILLQLLAPFAPHIAEELWEREGNSDLIIKSGWPQHDSEAVLADSEEIVIQVNGKVRGRIYLAPDIGKQKTIEKAKIHENVSNYLQGVKILKTVYIEHRLVNFVIKKD